MPTYVIQEYVEYEYSHKVEADNLEEALIKIANSEFPMNEAIMSIVSHSRYSRNTENGQLIDPKRFEAACDKLGLVCS